MARFSIVNGGGGGAALLVKLDKSNTVKAESDALVSKSKYVELSARMDGGFLSSLLRSALSNESIFFQVLEAKRDEQDVLLAPEMLGDIVLLEVTGDTQYKILNGAFLACESSVELSTTTQWDFKKATFGSGLFVLETSGTGTVAVNCTGSMVRYELTSGEKRSIDNGHVVAWSAEMKYEVGLASKSFMTSVASGEGMMCHFRGPGVIYVQTHKPINYGEDSTRTRGTARGGGVVCIIVLIFVFLFLLLGILAVVFGEEVSTVRQYNHHRQRRPGW